MDGIEMLSSIRSSLEARAFDKSTSGGDHIVMSLVDSIVRKEGGIKLSDEDCYTKAKAKGERTFTLRAQDITSPETTLFWMLLNCHSLPIDKLDEAYDAVREMLNCEYAKKAD